MEFLYTLRMLMLGLDFWRFEVEDVTYNVLRVGPVLVGYIGVAPLEEAPTDSWQPEPVEGITLPSRTRPALVLEEEVDKPDVLEVSMRRAMGRGDCCKCPINSECLDCNACERCG